jgi:small subunit ribosomal protein S6
MRPYEVMLILDSGVEDATVQSTVDKIKDFIGTRDGKIGQVEKWGRRRFAYELKHKWEGYYTLVEMTAEPDTIAALDRVLTLADEVIRHKIVRVPESVASRSTKPASTPEPAMAGAAASESTGE